MALLICKLLTGTYTAVSQFKRRRFILILVAVFLQHNINSVMYRKEEASDSLNNKLERQSRTEFVNNCSPVARPILPIVNPEMFTIARFFN